MTGAIRYPAAGAAGQHRRVAAPVEKDQALLAECEATLDGGQYGAGEAVLQLFAPRIDAAHRRHRLGHRPFRQLEQTVAAAVRVMKSFERGGGRA